MPPNDTVKQEAGTVFQSIFHLEKAERQPWAQIAVATVSYVLALWQLEVVLGLTCLFLVWTFAQAWLATGSIRIGSKGAFTTYGALQPASKWVFAPAAAGIAVVMLLALLPWKIPAAVVLGIGLAVCVAFDAVRSFSRRSAPPGPPFNTYSALSRAGSRPGAFLLSASAHAMLCILPALAVLVAVWLTPPEQDPPQKPVVVVELKLRPPEPLKEKTKQLPLPNARKVIVHKVEKPPEIDVGKLDLSRMAVEFAIDRDQALPSVLAQYGAHVAFVDPEDSDDFLHGKRQSLLSDYVYSAIDGTRSRPGIPVDISTEYILLLHDPELCPAIAQLKSRLGAVGSDLQVWLVFPRVARGFEQQLELAIRSQAQKQAAELHGSIISKVQLAFSTEDPGIAVQHVEAVAAPPDTAN